MTFIWGHTYPGGTTPAPPPPPGELLGALALAASRLASENSGLAGRKGCRCLSLILKSGFMGQVDVRIGIR
jgi:hypothetical protein